MGRDGAGACSRVPVAPGTMAACAAATDSCAPVDCLLSAATFVLGLLAVLETGLPDGDNCSANDVGTGRWYCGLGGGDGEVGREAIG